MNDQQIVGIIKNFRQVNTRTGRPMAAFFIDCVPVKCFDENVKIAAHAAEAGDRLKLSGEFCNYRGQIEFAANSITLDAQGQSGVKSGSESDAPIKAAESSEEAIVEKAPEGGGDILTGVIRDIRNIPTRSGLKMVTFRVGQYACKAFGEPAEALYKKSSEYNGQRIAIHGHWDANRRGANEFVAEDRYVPSGVPSFGASCSTEFNPSTQLGNATVPQPEPVRAPDQAVTDDEVEKIMQQALTDGAALAVEKQEENEQIEIKEEVKLAQITPGSSPTSPTVAARLIAPPRQEVAEKVPEVQGVISKIKSLPTSDGRKSIMFKIGPHSCWLFDQAAEFVEKHASDYDGKLVGVYGYWKINQRGRKEFVQTENISVTEPGPEGTLTADEVQRALEEALFRGSGLQSAGYTFEDMEAEYKANVERKKLEQMERTSVAAA